MAYNQGDTSVAQALSGLNTTRRQVQHWTEKGFIKTMGETGTGYTHDFPRVELQILRRMAQLVEVGVTPHAAAKIARVTIAQGVRKADLPHGISVIFT